MVLVSTEISNLRQAPRLPLRLYDPYSGTVCLDDMDLRHYSGPDIRLRFGVVPQDPFIFRTSIRVNLCLARPDATLAKIRRARELTNAGEFICKLPQRCETRVCEGGATLSGGQRLRLATEKNCDRILVTSSRKISQDGTYDELLQQPGIFRDFVQGQILRS